MAAGQMYNGKNLRIKVDNDLIFHATECSFNTTRNFEEIETKDTTGVVSTSGSYSWSLSSSAVVADIPSGSTTQVATKQILDKFTAGTEVDVAFSTYVVGDVLITGKAYVESVEVQAPTNGKATYTVNLRGSGDFTVALVPTP